MSYFLLALITAVIGVIPLLFARKFVSAFVVGFIAFVILFGIFYWLALGVMAPYLGGAVFFGAFLFAISASIAADGVSRWFAVPALYVVLLLGSAVVGCAPLHTSVYAGMIGQTETKVWSRDVQPKDVHHVRLIGDSTALYLAHKWVGTLGSVGSQFQVAEDYLTLQRVNGQLVYVVPLDFVGFSQWMSTRESPGYIVIDAQNPDTPPRVVQLPVGHRLKYMPGAGFDENLFRYLRHQGYVSVGFAEANFELDDQNNPHWIVPLYQRQVLWGAAKITSVLVVNPTTGDIARYSLDQAPAWIDRIIPRDLAKRYLKWHGQYAQGFGNTFWTRNSITKPEDPKLIYSSDNRAEWATGITSDRGSGNKVADSLLAIAYTDSRTGHTVYYTVDGGATDSAIVEAIDANQYVHYKNLHATTPQIYNLYGDMVAVAPLLNTSGAYQAVAFASVKNPQEVVIGQDVFEAGRNYQTILYRRNAQALPANSTALALIAGVVDRIRQDIGSENPYYVHLAGVPRIFTASSHDYPKLPLTLPGDHVSIQYVKSGETVVPVVKFDNTSLPLDQTPTQAAAEKAISASHDSERTTRVAVDVRKRLATMSDAELAKKFGNN